MDGTIVEGPARVNLTPIKRPRSVARFATSARLMEAEVPQPKVIVADASLEAATALAALLTGQGLEARAVDDGGEAIVAAEEWPADRAVVGTAIAGVAAIDVARHLRQSFGTAFRLVARASRSDPGDRERLDAAGFDRVVPAAAAPEELVAALSSEGLSLVMRSVAQTVRRMELLIVLGHSLLGARQVAPSQANMERARRIVRLVETDIEQLPLPRERTRLRRELEALAERVRAETSFSFL
jgi:CheY-like chemotaxis protein